MKIKKYGWKPQRPDFRDRVFHISHPKSAPTKIDLRPQDVPIYDQGDIGSCTGNSSVGAFSFDHKKQFGKQFDGSRLMAYYNGRAAEGTTDQDAGAAIRDVIAGLKQYGLAQETLWPYLDVNVTLPPEPAAVADGLLHPTVQYGALDQSLDALKTTLANSFPFVFGFSVYDSFESDAVAQTGIVPMPSPTENMIGGHAVMAVGYDDTKGIFIVRNSWGTGWGDKGYFYFPYDYISNPNLASDFWVIQAVKQ